MRLWEVLEQPGGTPGLALSAESNSEHSHSKPITSVAFSLDDKQIISTGSYAISTSQLF